VVLHRVRDTLTPQKLIRGVKRAKLQLFGGEISLRAFEPVEGPINERIDDAYRAKYHGSLYLSPMIGARARSATVKVMPRETNA